ncbi:MAG: hypothetical protein KBA26_08780 [Candidatus Delongbacteria bacterium]|nr:hypothetical protein [Candidatus Delongbacteria bacterium]
MKKTLLLILVDGRKQSAVNVQKILTEWGCLIKTRLGIHDGVLDSCSESGLMILELVGDPEKQIEMTRKLSLLPGVKAKLETLSMDE